MSAIKTQMAKVRNNPVGLVAGGVIAFLVAKKYGKVENMKYLIGISVVGALVGAHVQSYMKAKRSMPTSATVKNPTETTTTKSWFTV